MRFKQALMGSAILAVAATTNGGLAHAQATSGSTSSATIEEVVVTARKREESLQTIPVAVSSATGAMLEKQNIRQPSDLGRTVPSLTITSGNSGTVNNASVSIRGQVAADILINLSQPVGIYEDGVNIPHPVGSNNAFFDLERVEVLKGPQGTLYGRNTTGGAVNIITKAPNFAGLHGFAFGEYGNFSNVRYGGAINIPVVEDTLAFRVAYQHWDRDGYGRSRITGQKLGGDHDDDLARIEMRLAPPASSLTMDVKYEYSQAKRNGNLSTARAYNGNPTAAFEAAAFTNYGLYQPLIFQGVALGNAAALGPVIAAGAAAINSCVSDDLFTSCQGTVSRDDVKTHHAVVDLNWDITDAVHLRSLSGYHAFTNDRLFDLDGLPYQMLEVGVGVGGIQPNLGSAPKPYPTFPYNVPHDQESQQFSQEFNLSGEAAEGKLNWLVGAFWAQDEGKGAQQFIFFPTFFRSLSPTGAGSIQGAGHDQLKVTNQTWAVFTQNDFKFNDVVSVTLGARYTEERLGQDLSDFSYQTATGLFSCTAGALAGRTFTTLEGCTLHKSATFSGTSYLASLNLQLAPSTLLYFKTARGFRGGALQGRDADAPAVAPETATDYEIGFKSDFFDHRLRSNLAIYQTNYSNKQETTITINPQGATTTILRNAAQARIKGAEVEIQIRPIQPLSVFMNGSYTHAKYLKYPTALDFAGRPVDGSGAAFNIPKIQANIGARYEFEAGPGVLAVQGDYAFRGRIPGTVLNYDGTAPSALLQEFRGSIGLVNARVEYVLPDKGLTLSVFANNLTNEHYQVTSISAANAGGVQNGLTQEPRVYGFNVRKTFGDE